MEGGIGTLVQQRKISSFFFCFVGERRVEMREAGVVIGGEVNGWWKE